MKKMILAAALLFSACATAQQEEQAVASSGETLDIRVNNNIVPPVILTISLVPTSGPERNLGQAWSSRATEFRYNGIAPRGQYRLVARASDNRAMASDVLVLDGVQALEWTLQSNRVTILRTRND